MLVGKADIDLRELEVRAGDKDKFLDYVDSLVPIDFKHIPSIVSNQRYICCQLLRTSNKVSWEVKKDLIDSIMLQISIVGYTDSLIEANTLFGVINKDKVLKYRRKECRR